MRQFKSVYFRRTLFGIVLIALALLATACGSNATSASSTTSVGATPTSDPNHVSLAQTVGSPTAKATTGTAFQVTGQVKNLDTKQHDIHLKATLTDSSGKVVGTATGLADNVQGGQTDDYTLTGTLTQSTWTNVSVVITKVTENVNGEGSD